VTCLIEMAFSWSEEQKVIGVVFQLRSKGV
jgi:hypothetical protein